jgi:hypothetical protein
MVDLYQISVGQVPNIFIFMIFRKDIMIIFAVNPLPSSFIRGGGARNVDGGAGVQPWTITASIPVRLPWSTIAEIEELE